MKKLIFSLSGLFSVLILCFSFSACQLDPLTWTSPSPPAFEGKLSLNQELQSIQKLSLQGWHGAEDIIFDEEGNLYTGVHKGKADFSDGKILKINPKGEVEIFYDAGSWVAGLHFDEAGNLLALSHKEGLIKISPDKKVSVLAKHDATGKAFHIPNGLEIASDGMIYFTNTASASPYNIKFGRKLILEARETGGLYQYDPQKQKVSKLIDGLHFGNGIVLSQNEDYLLVVETTRYRVLKYWLQGAKKGESEIFIENLPGFPNGISQRPDGSFWLGFTTKRNQALDDIHSKKWMKQIVYALPEGLQPKQDLFGMVLNLSESGEILQALFDPTGKWVSEAGAVKEYQGKLYLGGDIVPYISSYSLN